MECNHKIRIRVNPKDPNENIYYMLVPCGKCPICLSKKRQKWLVRLESELKYCLSAYFVTLTYDEAHMKYTADGLQTLCKRDCQLFMKRLRKMLKGYKLKYYLCSEYGSHTMRPHYHMMLYLYADDNDMPIDAFHMHYNIISKCWLEGLSDVRDANSATANYCLKDTLKLEVDKINATNLMPTFRLISKGLGERESYEKAKKGYSFTYFVQDGKKVGIPRYMRDKMFSVLDAEIVTNMKQDIEKAMFKESVKNYKELQKIGHEKRKEMYESKEYSIVQRAKKNSRI